MLRPQDKCFQEKRRQEARILARHKAQLEQAQRQDLDQINQTVRRVRNSQTPTDTVSAPRHDDVDDAYEAYRARQVDTSSHAAIAAVPTSSMRIRKRDIHKYFAVTSTFVKDFNATLQKVIAEKCQASTTTLLGKFAVLKQQVSVLIQYISDTVRTVEKGHRITHTRLSAESLQSLKKFVASSRVDAALDVILQSSNLTVPNPDQTDSGVSVLGCIGELIDGIQQVCNSIVGLQPKERFHRDFTQNTVAELDDCVEQLKTSCAATSVLSPRTSVARFIGNADTLAWLGRLRQIGANDRNTNDRHSRFLPTATVGAPVFARGVPGLLCLQLRDAFGNAVLADYLARLPEFPPSKLNRQNEVHTPARCAALFLLGCQLDVVVSLRTSDGDPVNLPLTYCFLGSNLYILFKLPELGAHSKNSEVTVSAEVRIQGEPLSKGGFIEAPVEAVDRSTSMEQEDLGSVNGDTWLPAKPPSLQLHRAQSICPCCNAVYYHTNSKDLIFWRWKSTARAPALSQPSPSPLLGPGLDVGLANLLECFDQARRLLSTPGSDI